MFTLKKPVIKTHLSLQMQPFLKTIKYSYKQNFCKPKPKTKTKKKQETKVSEFFMNFLSFILTRNQIKNPNHTNVTMSLI